MPMDEESSPLINDVETSEVPAKSWTRSLILGGCASLLFIGAVASSQGGKGGIEPSSELRKAKDENYLSWGTDDDATGWYIYKATYAGSDHETARIMEFMAVHSGGTDCAVVDLGCDGRKVTCTYGTGQIDKQVHYVIAPILTSNAVDGDNMGVNGWNDMAMKEYGEMNDFSSFMHDKVQHYVSDVISKGKELEAAGYSVMRRISKTNNVDNISGEESEDEITMGHVMVAVSGKVWDFMGRISDTKKAEAEGFNVWEAHECKAAHEVNGYDFDLIDEDNTDDVTTWLSVHVATSSLSSKGMKQIKGAYHDITGAIMTEETGEYCDVLTIHFHNADEQTTGGHFGISTYIKYVVNHNHQDIGGGKTIADYETYVAAVHERYLAKPADGVDAHRWRNWDHFLDAHIGLKFQGLASDADVETSHAVTDDVDRIYLQDTCLSTNEAITEVMLDTKAWVGKRSPRNDGDNYYTAFDGNSMSLLFSIQCHYGQQGTDDVCTCNAENSDNLAMEYFDMKVSSCLNPWHNGDGNVGPQDGPWGTTGTPATEEGTMTGGDKPNSS